MDGIRGQRKTGRERGTDRHGEKGGEALKDRGGGREWVREYRTEGKMDRER